VRRGAALFAIATTLIGLAAGFALKNQCTTHEWDGFQYRSSCYSDIIALYGARGLDREPIPYVNGDGRLTEREAGDLEYPVGTGYFIAATARWVDNATSFFHLSAIGLGLAGAGVAIALSMVVTDRKRLSLFAFAPPLVLYAFHNWDLLAVLAMVIALVAFARGADGAAGAAIGFGAATKLFPAVLLPVLVLARARRDRAIPWRMVAWSASAFAAWNVPVLLSNPVGWWFPWEFQSTRLPNFETSWYFVLRHLRGFADDSFWFGDYGRLASLVSTTTFVVALAIYLRAAWKRPAFEPFALSLGALALFLMTAKVYSPQYALWLLPLFVLVRMPWHSYVAFVVTDAFVWFSVAAFLLNIDAPTSGYLNLLEGAVIARYVVLGWIVWLTLRAKDVSEEPIPARVYDRA